MVGCNWAKIADLIQKRCFGNSHFSDFYLLIVPYLKKVLRVDPEI